MDQEIVPQTTLRDTLTASFESAEAGTLPTPEEVRARDEQGRFAKKQVEAQAEAQVAEIAQAKPVAAPQAPATQAPPQRPITTWKKEYLGMYDKLAAGLPLTAEESKKLADYSVQRENEYKTGVSTYKTEAMQAKDLQEAITPFLPELQARNMAPAAWIKQLGSAHYALAKGTPELKLQVFRELARQYGVPLAAVGQDPGQVPPIVHELLGQIQQLKNDVQGVSTWRQQQEETSLTSEVSKYAQDTQNYPHFEAVREDMARLLETSAARDLPTAYKMAVRMNDELYEQDVNQRLSKQTSSQANVVAKARANAVSPKSATPSGPVTSANPKDRRALLSEAFDAQGGGRV